MSLYADYVHERTNKQVLETDKAFLTYYFTDATTCYIEDIYVAPEYRKSNVAAELANQVVLIAKERGCTKLLGSVVPSTKGSTASIKVLLAYGMKVDSAINDFIVFSKEI